MKKNLLLFLMILHSSILLAQNTFYHNVNKTYSERLRSKAEAGDPHAMNDMGSSLDRGDGIAQNHTEAFKWFKKAAEAGNALAQYNLGYYFHEGIATARDFAKALYWYEKSAGDTMYNFGIAQWKLADMYYKGEGMPEKNYAKALYWYEKSANSGVLLAQYNLGEMYYKGEGTILNYEKALFWYRKSAAQNLVLALYKIGECYEMGRGVAKDTSVAFHWYQKAAVQKLPVALYKLGRMYYEGNGAEQNMAKAFSCWEQAVSEGWDDARTMYSLGVGYYTETNVKAITYLQLAIDSPKIDNAAKGDALQKLSACYRFGRCGVTADEKKADELMQQAAACGNSNAEKIQEWLNIQ